nr:zinc ribbon domain-containing protein [Mammaliicoccus lentus]
MVPFITNMLNLWCQQWKKTLDIRNWTCECGAEHDRDINASKNIKNEGLRQIQSFDK